MIESRIFYYIKCDECKRSSGGAVYEKEEHRVTINAAARGWVAEDGKHICPNCIYKRYLNLKYKAGRRTNAE